MKEVLFNPEGGLICARALFPPSSVAVANYEMILRFKSVNAGTTLLTGDNLNLEDDQVFLPSPVETNDGRRVILETGFRGLDITDQPNYTITLEIWQDGNLLGSDEESGQFTEAAQYSLIFIKLVKQDQVI